MSIPAPLNNRAIAMLRAVAANRAEMTTRCGPSLRIDGLPCCDQITAGGLAGSGLIRPAGGAGHGCGPDGWVRAELTAQGWAAVAPRLRAAA
ncbi:MAG TPA: hypothetical protein VGJ95_23455 [Pseudonocardiaceae bacterium]|jgi:hypothetical protein